MRNRRRIGKIVMAVVSIAIVSQIIGLLWYRFGLSYVGVTPIEQFYIDTFGGLPDLAIFLLKRGGDSLTILGTPTGLVLVTIPLITSTFVFGMMMLLGKTISRIIRERDEGVYQIKDPNMLKRKIECEGCGNRFFWGYWSETVYYGGAKAGMVRLTCPVCSAVWTEKDFGMIPKELKPDYAKVLEQSIKVPQSPIEAAISVVEGQTIKQEVEKPKTIALRKYQHLMYPNGKLNPTTISFKVYQMCEGKTKEEIANALGKDLDYAGYYLNELRHGKFILVENVNGKMVCKRIARTNIATGIVTNVPAPVEQTTADL